MNRLLTFIILNSFIVAVLIISSCGNGMDVILKDNREEGITPSPVSISSVFPGDREVTINWTDPTETGFDHVKISWAPGGTSQQIVTDGIENCTVSGLSNGTDYVFTLVSVSNSGKESSPVSLTSCPYDNKAPANVSINSWEFSEPDTIIVNWTDPADIDFHHIKINCSPVGPADVTVTGGTGSYSAVGLSIYDTDHTFTFVSVDDDGNQSLPVTVNMPHLDIVPPGLVSLITSASAPGEITLSWGDPADPDFDHVLITWTPGGSTSQAVIAGIESFTATGMSIYNTDYTFSIISVDSEGNQSSPATINVPHIDIVPPGEIVMNDADSTINSITLNWTDPGDTDLDYITVGWIPDSGSQNVVAGTETLIATGLTWGIEYTFTVVAVDSSGNESNPVTFTVTPKNGTPTRFIYTAEDLNAVRGGVTGYEDWGLDDHYNVMANIDLSGYASWVPIGIDSTLITPFTGRLDGNCHIITGLTIYAPGDNNQGLFGSLDGSTVKNLNIDGFNITGQQYVGSVAGYFNSSASVSNCHVRGNIEAVMMAGGLIGSGGANSCDISNSSAQVDISLTGTYMAGGLIAMFRGTISNSYARGIITSINSGQYLGGFVGGCTIPGTTITNSYASVTVTSTIASSPYLGGFTGSNNGSPPNAALTGTYYDQLAMPSDNGIGTNVTTSDMKFISTFSGWDFADIWGMDPLINDGYPYLRSNPLY